MFKTRLALTVALAVGCVASADMASAAEGRSARACKLAQYSFTKLKKVDCENAKKVFKKVMDSGKPPKGWTCAEVAESTVPRGSCKKANSEPKKRKSFDFAYIP